MIENGAEKLKSLGSMKKITFLSLQTCSHLLRMQIQFKQEAIIHEIVKT